MIRVLVFALALLVLFPDAAQAGPVAGLIGAIGTTIKAGGFAASLLKMAGSFALSFLAQKIMGKPKQPGQQIDAPTTGEAVSESFIVGRWAKGGHFVYHGSHGQSGDTPNAYYQRVFELSGMAGARIRAVIMEGRYVTFEDPITAATIATTTDVEGTPEIDGEQANRLPFGDTPAEDDTDYGLAATNAQFVKGSRAYFWLKWWDGSQTAADAQLVDTYSAADNPWPSTAVGDGIVYAVLTWRYDREVWSRGVPDVRFVIDGIPLYDPRADTSVGGDGSQRWADRSTWGRTENPVVIAYNVARGITLPNGAVYGGGYPDADQLPIDNWVAAMNVCDESVTTDEGGTRKRYTFGAEIKVAEIEPADVMDACMTDCSGEFAPRGDKLYVHVGAPEVETVTITDNDISASDPESFDPILGLAERFNAVAVSHIDPRLLWEVSNLSERTNTTWETEDGGRRLTADLRLNGVFNRGQADALGQEYINDARRERRHQFALPPEYARLRCLNTISWTSARNGYDNKLFEVVSIEQRPDDLFAVVTLRERDPSDYPTPSDPALLPAVTAPDRTPAQTVTGFAVAPVTITNAGGQSRAGIEMTWTAAALSDVKLLEWQARIGADVVATGTAAVAEGSALVSGAELAATDYEVRARPIADRATLWTDWEAVTTNDVRLSLADLDSALSLEIQQSGAALAADPNLYNVVAGSPNTSPGWTLDASAFFNDTEALNGTYSIAVFTDTGTAVAAENTVLFEVLPGYRYAVACSVWRGASAEFDNLQVGLRWYDAAGDPLSDSWVSSGSEASVTATTWVSLRGQVTAPAGAAYARLAARYDNKTTGGTVRWDGFECRRADAEALIGPGGVTTPEIAANAVTEVRSDTADVTDFFNSWTTVASVTFAPESAGNALQIYFSGAVNTTSGSTEIDLRFRAGGVVIPGGRADVLVLVSPIDLLLQAIRLAANTSSLTIDVQIIRTGGAIGVEVLGDLIVIESKR